MSVKCYHVQHDLFISLKYMHHGLGQVPIMTMFMSYLYLIIMCLKCEGGIPQCAETTAVDRLQFNPPRAGVFRITRKAGGGVVTTPPWNFAVRTVRPQLMFVDIKYMSTLPICIMDFTFSLIVEVW